MPQRTVTPPCTIAFLRSEDSFGRVAVHPPASRNRMGPIQGYMTPKMELNSALLAAWLANLTKSSKTKNEAFSKDVLLKKIGLLSPQCNGTIDPIVTQPFRTTTLLIRTTTNIIQSFVKSKIASKIFFTLQSYCSRPGYDALFGSSLHVSFAL